MSRYIDADRLKNGIMQYADKYGEISCSVTAFNILLERFAADVAEVKHGRLILIDTPTDYASIYKCSVCGQYLWIYHECVGKWHYCPNCGSRMDLDGDAE